MPAAISLILVSIDVLRTCWGIDLPAVPDVGLALYFVVHMCVSKYAEVVNMDAHSRAMK
jgi:hypothetical protein